MHGAPPQELNPEGFERLEEVNHQWLQARGHFDDETSQSYRSYDLETLKELGE